MECARRINAQRMSHNVLTRWPREVHSGSGPAGSSTRPPICRSTSRPAARSEPRRRAAPRPTPPIPVAAAVAAAAADSPRWIRTALRTPSLHNQTRGGAFCGWRPPQMEKEFRIIFLVFFSPAFLEFFFSVFLTMYNWHTVMCASNEDQLGF